MSDEALRARVAELEAVLWRLDEAITDQGPMPEYHQRIMLRHRDEWPTLWDAIDAARAALGEQDTEGNPTSVAPTDAGFHTDVPTGSCEDDCQTECAYPGRFAECGLAAPPVEGEH